jgi:hypothetical protein
MPNINYHRRYRYTERPYGAYKNMFILTGDSKQKIDPCKPKVVSNDAYNFQRCVKYGDFEDTVAFLKMEEDRQKAIHYIAFILENELELLTEEQCLDIDINKRPEEYNNVGWFDSLDDDFKNIDSKVVCFYKKNGETPTSFEDLKNPNNNYTILGELKAYARPYDDHLHLYIGHGNDYKCCSTEQADVREGGYEFLTNGERWVYGDYWLGLNCNDPLLLHFESSCAEQTVVKDSYTKQLYNRNVCFDEANCNRMGCLFGMEKIVSNEDKCYVHKKIRVNITFPYHEYKYPPDPEDCELCSQLEPCTFNCNATGLAVISFNKKSYELSWNILYKDLSSDVKNAHFYYKCGESKESILDILEYSFTYNPLCGTVDLSKVIVDERGNVDQNRLDDVIDQLFNNNWYIHISTECNPQGELQGCVVLKHVNECQQFCKPSKQITHCKINKCGEPSDEEPPNDPRMFTDDCDRLHGF